MKKLVIMLIAIIAVGSVVHDAGAVISKKDSVVVYRPSTATWYGSRTQAGAGYLNPFISTQVGWGWPGFAAGDPNQIPLIGDVNGDGIDDIVLLQKQASNQYYWVALHSTISNGLGSFGTSGISSHIYDTANWGASSGFGTVSDKRNVFLADINGDGKKDAVYNGNDYGWLAILSTSAGLTNNGTVQGPAYINRPAGYVVPRPNGGTQVGDFDGDGQADICFVCYWDGTNARWLIKKTSGGIIGAGAQVDGFFGLNNDTFLVGDINGDGRADAIAVRNWDGTNLWWGVKYAAADGTIDGAADTSAFFGWVGTGDIPFVADINGDGKKDIGVIRYDSVTGAATRIVSFTNGTIGLADGTLQNAPYGFAGVSDSEVFGKSSDVSFIGKLGSRCITGDYSGDCVVNFADFATFAKNWMINCTVTPGDPACSY